jgi:DNA-binding MarR family transcriptional regulator
MGTRSRPDRRPGLEPLADTLHSATIHLLRLLRREDRALGVGPSQLSALSVLVFGGPQTPGRLATIEQVSRPTMTRVVAGLERSGLARRTPHPEDGRAFVLRATPAGTRLMRRGRKLRVARLARALARLTPKERMLLDRASGLIRRLSRSEPKRL